MLKLLIKDRVNAVKNPLEEHSMQSRLVIWGWILQDIWKIPDGILGRGLGTVDAHSYYLSILADTGIPGFVLFLIILIPVFRAGIRLHDRCEDPDRKLLIRLLLTILFLFSAGNLTGTHINNSPGNIYFWFACAILMRMRYLTDTPLTDDPLNNLPHRSFPPVAG
jgi:hypothetical protein